MPSCGWCNSPDLPKWEARVAAGETLAAIAASTPFSESAARRHVRLHLQPRLGLELRDPASTVHLSDFVDRLMRLATRAAAVGDYAFEANDGRLALEAIRTESATLATLTDRLGIDSGEAAANMREAKAAAKVINRAINSGELRDLESLAWLADDEGAPALADALRARARQRDLASITDASPNGAHS